MILDKRDLLIDTSTGETVEWPSTKEKLEQFLKDNPNITLHTYRETREYKTIHYPYFFLDENRNCAYGFYNYKKELSLIFYETAFDPEKIKHTFRPFDVIRKHEELEGEAESK